MTTYESFQYLAAGVLFCVGRYLFGEIMCQIKCINLFHYKSDMAPRKATFQGC